MIVFAIIALSALVFMMATAPRSNPYWNKEMAKWREIERRDELIKLMIEPDPAILKMMEVTKRGKLCPSKNN